MAALACLKIFVGDDLRFADSDSMAALVAKVAGAYLETTWLWPRRHGLVAPFSFVLTDPRAVTLDPRELQALARALQHKLFGDTGEGEIALLTFEGDQSDVMRFAGTPTAALQALLDGEDDGEFAGRICRITPDGVVAIAPPGGPIVGEPPMEALEAEPVAVAPARVAYRGVFHAPRQVFVGNFAVWREAGAASSFGFDLPTATVNDPASDIPVLNGAKEMLTRFKAGTMFLPISFSTVIQSSARAGLLTHLEALPRVQRGRLAAAVYDTPRAPSFSALSQVKRSLEPFFSRIGLRVSDPAFQIDDLPPGVAESITLHLPVASEAVRLAAMARFMRDAASYRRKRVWQGVADLGTRRELNAALELGVPFLTGPAITELLEAPTDVVSCPALHLPLHDWSQEAEGAVGDLVA